MFSRPYFLNFASAQSWTIASYLVPAMRPQYLFPSSRLLSEIATTSFNVSFILRPSIFRYF